MDSINETHEVRALDHDVQTAVGVVEAGTVAAIRFEVQAMASGRPWSWWSTSLASTTMQRPTGLLCRDQRDCYQIHLAGSPNIDCELKLTDDQGGSMVA